MRTGLTTRTKPLACGYRQVTMEQVRALEAVLAGVDQHAANALRGRFSTEPRLLTALLAPDGQVNAALVRLVEGVIDGPFAWWHLLLAQLVCDALTARGRRQSREAVAHGSTSEAPCRRGRDLVRWSSCCWGCCTRDSLAMFLESHPLMRSTCFS